MNTYEVNPYVHTVSLHSSVLAPYHLNRRIILDYELYYVEDGELIISYNDKDFLCHKGDILLLCPNIPNTFHFVKGELVQSYIHFDLQYDSKSEHVFLCYRDYDHLTPDERSLIRENMFPHLSSSPFVKISNKKKFLEKFHNVAGSQNLNSLACKADMLYMIDAIVAENAPNAFEQPRHDPGIVNLIKGYIDSNYEYEIHLDNLEKQFCYSKYYIEKLFKKEMGISIIKYLNQKKMQAAADLLQKHSVSETSQMLNYSSIYTFSRAFRFFYGVSPTEYLYRIQNTKDDVKATEPPGHIRENP